MLIWVLLAAVYEPMEGCLRSCDHDSSELKLKLACSQDDCTQPSVTPGGFHRQLCVSSTWEVLGAVSGKRKLAVRAGLFVHVQARGSCSTMWFSVS